MVLITGGSYQGKTRYAKERFSRSDSDIADGGTCGLSELKTAKCVNRYELVVKRLLESGEDPLKFTEELECAVVIMTEIGSGIIPLDKNERLWREMTGRAGCIIADRAVQVVRLCCGIAEVIK